MVPVKTVAWCHICCFILMFNERLRNNSAASEQDFPPALPVLFFFADQSCRDGRAVHVPQQPPARRGPGRGARTPGCHQVWVAQEARGVRQNVAQPLVRPARGSAALLQRRGGNQAAGKTESPSTTAQPQTR